MLSKDIQEHSGNIFSFAFSLCQDRDLAGDLTQECMEKALKKKHQLDDANALKPWLASILMNCWKDFLKRKKPVEDIANYEIASADNPEKEHARDQIVHDVRHAIDSLPIAYREVIMLVDIFEMTYMETAETLNVPIGTVMSRISRARGLLRDKLLHKQESQSDKTGFLKRIK